MTKWPGWETVKLIGRGSFGAVYEIKRILEKVDIEEKAALKVISIPQNVSDIEEMYNDGYDNESITETFNEHLNNIVAEYSMMKKMNDCVNIVNCDDIRYIQHDDGIGWDIFIKMELLTPLTKSLPEAISDDIVIKLGSDICNALVACKKFDVVHRDIKPQNIFISPNGDYKLGDFGIAKTVEKTMGGTKIGTYKYMAPEVYNNRPYGSSADIYSLGLVMYWLLNEHRMPFLPLPPEKIGVSKEEEARCRRMSGEPLPPPKNGSDRLKQIVLKACEYDPKDRFLSAAEMCEALNNINKAQEIKDTPVVSVTVDDSGTVGSEKASDTGVHPVASPVNISTQKAEPIKKKDDSGKMGGKDAGNKKSITIITALTIVVIAVIAGFAIGNNRDNVDCDLSTDEVSVSNETDKTKTTTKDSENSAQDQPSIEIDSVYKSVNEKVYVIEAVNMRPIPDSSSASMGLLLPGDSIERIAIGDNGWSKVAFYGDIYFVLSECLTIEKPVELTTTKPTTTKPITEATTTEATTTEPTTTEATTTEQTTTEATTTEPTTTQTNYSDWVVGEWQDSQKATNDLCQLIETRTLYPYFYYYCKKCGDTTRWYKPGDGCGKCGTVMDSAYCKIVWLTNPWSEATHYRPFGQDTGYYAIHIDTLAYWKWTGGSPKTQYKYKTRIILN